MTLLSNPNLAYVLVVSGITLLLLGSINSKTVVLSIGMVIFLIATLVGFLYLRINPWALMIVALSPLPFFGALRQARPQNPLFLLTIFMLTIGSYFLFVDQDNLPVVSNRVVWVSILSAIILWISTERLRNVEGVRLSDSPDSLIGLIGETVTDIEPHSAGSVVVNEETWIALSKEHIPSGSRVRVIRQHGHWLTVKKVEELTRA